MDMNYDVIKKKVPDFFCVRNLREIYKSDEYDFKLSFLDFLMCLEDFYTFVYSTRLSKTSWLLFTWLRTLVRYDGYVKLAYKDVSSKFCENRNVISKPTFFKCIDELDSFGLIKRISNKKLFDSKYQKDVNTYIVVSKIDEILPLLESISNQIDFYETLKKEYFNSKIQKEKKQKEKQQISENKELYTIEYVMEKEYFKEKDELNDFFKFLGSTNKTKNIAKTRKQKILNVIMGIYPYDEELSYAISQTITKGIKSEKYMYAILRNMCNENEEEEELDETQKELKNKYKKNTVTDYDTHMGINEFNMAKKTILEKEKGFVSVQHDLKQIKYPNEYETKLLKVCAKLETKFNKLKKYEKYRGKRLNILCDMNICEWINYDSCWNEVIHWTYGEEEYENIITIKEMEKLSKKYADAFVFCEFQFMNERVK